MTVLLPEGWGEPREEDFERWWSPWITAHLLCLGADAGLTPGGPALVRVCK